MPDTIHVKAHPQVGNRVGLWDPGAGPGGHYDEQGRYVDGSEVWVAGQDAAPVEVLADHPAVLDALEQKRVMRVEGEALRAAQEAAGKAEEQRRAARRAARLAIDPDADPKRLQAADDRAAELERELAEARAEMTRLRAGQEAASGGSAAGGGANVGGVTTGGGARPEVRERRERGGAG